MQLIRQIHDQKSPRPTAVAIGNFDGLHRGHQAVMGAMRALAAQHKLAPAVLTFEPHPRQFFAPDAPAFRLEPRRSKFHRLGDAGVELLFAAKFNAALASMPAEQFLDQVLGQQLQARAVITGENFAFGKGRAGDGAMLKAWGEAQGVAVSLVPPVTVDGMACSSTAIRQALAAGDVVLAARLLGRPYSMTGVVVRGAQRGRTIGCPTANLVPASFLTLPRFGVYAVRVAHRGKMYDGVANLGVKPTVDAVAKPGLEVHLFDFSGDLYGQRLDVSLLARLRDEQRFDSFAALTTQIAQDADAARQILKEIA